ncbi:MAG: 3-dehydroquinate synthase [Ktedonobacteraceae bacterium]|nr:3-dehydroquinate synthase [Ktedonobacteraceae bacterium]
MRHIFFIGLPGSGKSTIGRLLARYLGYTLYDVDTLIEKETGERIAAIFARHGEDYFRSWESRLLAKAIQQDEQCVVVTGGGIVTRAENRALMAEHGVRVFLEVEPAEALRRLREQHTAALLEGATPETRPLLEGPDPLATLQRLLAQRLAWYEEAELRCTTEGKSPEQVAQEVAAMLIGSGNVQSTDEMPIVQQIHVGDGYEAIVEWGGAGRLARYLTPLHLPERVFLITDSNLAPLYLPSVTTSLQAAGFDPQSYVVPAGEASKSAGQLNTIYDWLVDLRAERREAMIAFGGGVIGDLVGFAAATYLRGMPLIHVPTSLLAQVDSAIGGKTGINHKRGKNLIGAFYHPRLVLADPALLLTLPRRARTEGWAEVVKYGIILDTELFALLEANAEALRAFSHPPIALLCQVIARCISLKAAVIEEDEREQGRRAILNYGHTIGHALENVAGYGEWLHGEAVSLGMVAAARLALAAGLFSGAETERQNRLLQALGLPTTYQGPVRAEDILAAIQLDKKVQGKRVRWVLPQHIGEVVVTHLPDELVRQVITAFFRDDEWLCSKI